MKEFTLLHWTLERTYWSESGIIDCRVVVVRYRTARGSRSQWNTVRVMSAAAAAAGTQPVTSLTLYELRSNALYEMMVLARNRVGDPLFSDVVTVRTKGQL